MKDRSKTSLALIALLVSIMVMTLADEAKLDLNIVTRRELEAIPGIGPSLASRIVYERTKRGGFRNMKDLLKIQGVGRKTLARLEKYLYVVDAAEINGRSNHD